VGGGTVSDLLDEGYRRAAAITREHGTTYYWGARLLPRESRRHVHAIYALARIADDIVDGSAPGPTVAASLDEFEQSFWSALHTGTTDDPVLAAASTSARLHRLDDECFARFFRAMRADLTRTTYDTWDDLLGYMDGSAAVIGDLMLPVLGAPEQARPAAQALGLAFQLTNFLRDVGEDLDRGRVYLPQEDLRFFGADPARRTNDEAWRALMRFEVARNRRLYAEADAGIAALPLRARRCVVTARLLYARILDEIEAVDHDVFSTRARVPTSRKAALAARVSVSRDPAARLPRGGPSAEAWPDDDRVVLLDGAGAAIGVAAKSTVHHDATPRHLGFSCYVVDDQGRLLVSVRAEDKTSFPGVATNTACGHPRPGEHVALAVRRRLRHELGLEVGDVRVVLPAFAYTARTPLLLENEACPVLLAHAASSPSMRLDPTEVAEAWWVDWASFRDVALGDEPRITSPSGRTWALSPWCVEQVAQLAALGPDPLSWQAPEGQRLPPALDDGVAPDA
jgi:isopentenyl-diphosphate delta-isomerase type 1